MNAIGLGEHRLHDLRHTFAVVSLQNGDDVKTVQGNMGHKHSSTTLDTYGHVVDSMQQASADRMNQFVERLKTAE